ncbi:MAG: hypothetical protein ACQEQV_11130 [Fibrobacterota bacterium]
MSARARAAAKQLSFSLRNSIHPLQSLCKGHAEKTCRFQGAPKANVLLRLRFVGRVNDEAET